MKLVNHTFFKDFIYLFIFRQRGREGKREGEKHQCVVVLECPLLETWLTTQACALTGNPNGDPLVSRPALNPLSHTQGWSNILILFKFQNIIWNPCKFISHTTFSIVLLTLNKQYIAIYELLLLNKVMFKDIDYSVFSNVKHT